MAKRGSGEATNSFERTRYTSSLWGALTILEHKAKKFKKNAERRLRATPRSVPISPVTLPAMPWDK